jgi:hypothetical protein
VIPKERPLDDCIGGFPFGYLEIVKPDRRGNNRRANLGHIFTDASKIEGKLSA